MMEPRENKYSICSKLFPIVISGQLEHALVMKNDRLTSAGFCKISEKVTAFGYSNSLKLKYADGDETHIAKLFKGETIKYLIIGNDAPIIFHPAIEHLHLTAYYKARSGGKCRISFKKDTPHITVFGEAPSIGKIPKAKDKDKLQELLQAYM